MNDINHLLLITVVDLFIFFYGDNWNKQVGCLTLMLVMAFSSVISVLWCGHKVLWRNPFGLKLESIIECSDVLVEYE